MVPSNSRGTLPRIMVDILRGTHHLVLASIRHTLIKSKEVKLINTLKEVLLDKEGHSKGLLCKVNMVSSKTQVKCDLKDMTALVEDLQCSIREDHPNSSSSSSIHRSIRNLRSINKKARTHGSIQDWIADFNNTSNDK